MCAVSDSFQGNPFFHKKIESQTNIYTKRSVRDRSTLHAYVDSEEDQFPPQIQLRSDFRDLATRSTIFADKSLLIQDIMEDPSESMLIAMPRRWGKTVNLDMLKRFLEIPTDDDYQLVDEAQIPLTDNYQIFRKKCVVQSNGEKAELAIAKANITVQCPKDIFKRKKINALTLQGTYPVIYIDFKNCKPSDNTYKTFEDLFRAQLENTFSQHSYLQNSPKLKPEQRREMRKYLGIPDAESSEQYTDVGLKLADVELGLQKLSHLLHTHHDKKVWILVDEYDAVANVAYREFSEDDCDQTIGLLQSVYEKALKSNKYLEKGVLTGVQYIAKSGMLSGLNNLNTFDFTDAVYAQHYGLDEEEVRLFFEHFNVPSKLAEGAKEWYDGYRVAKYNASGEFVNKYNVWSIVKYLNKGDFSQFKSYWEQSGNIDFLKKLLPSSFIRKELERLVAGGSISFVRKAGFSAYDFSILKHMLGGNKEITQKGKDALFSYLFTGGYLTLASKKNHYCLPNMEITYEMGRRLITYYQTKCTIDLDLIKETTDVLQQIIDEGESNRDRLPKLLKDLHHRFGKVIQDINLVTEENTKGIFMNEDIVHSILNYIAIQTQHTALGSELYTKKIDTNGQGRVDLMITKGKVGVILEVKCVPTRKRDNKHMEEALAQAKNYCNKLTNTTDQKIFLAINVDKSASSSEQRPVELLCSWCDDDRELRYGINTAGNATLEGEA